MEKFKGEIQVITDKEWQAVIENDSSYDDVFRYAVKTTKIYCRPSCHSRLPKKENIDIFYDLDAPEKNGYRPCKRCRPNDVIVDNCMWVEEIEEILQKNYQTNLTLEELAYLAHGSESHVRHVFKKVTKQTPQQRLTAIRIAHAKRALIHSEKTVEQIATHVGLPNVSYFIKVFKARVGESPKQYRLTNE